MRAELRVWEHQPRLLEASRRWHERRGGSSGWGATQEPGGDGEAEPVEHEVSLRVWFRRPDRWREEQRALRGGRNAEIQLVIAGTTWWSYDADWGALTNERTPDHGHGPMLDLTMLDPGPLIAPCDFGVTGRTHYAGRAALRVEARPIERSLFPDTVDYVAQSPLELIVDEERGVLLARTDLLDGQPFRRGEVVEIAFDEPLPDDLFVLVPPAGTTMHDVGERMRRGQSIGPVPPAPADPPGIG